MPRIPASALALALASLTSSVALPCLAERPADQLARMRGTSSQHTGALGSAFPQQHVEAYEFTPCRPAFFPRPPCDGRAVVTCPAAGGIATLAVTGSPGATLPPGRQPRILAGPAIAAQDAPSRDGRILLAAAPDDAPERDPRALPSQRD